MNELFCESNNSTKNAIERSARLKLRVSQIFNCARIKKNIKNYIDFLTVNKKFAGHITLKAWLGVSVKFFTKFC